MVNKRIKKLGSAILLLFLIPVLMYAEENGESYNFLNLQNTGYFIDDLFVDALRLFSGAYYYYFNIATKLALFFLIITLLWASFKLWFGTIDIRKVVVDVVCKVALYMTFISVYPVITNQILSIAVRLGESSIDGNNLMVTGIGSIVESVDNTVTTSSKLLTKELTKSSFSTLSEKDIAFVASYTFCSPEEAKSNLEKLWGNKIEINNNYNNLISDDEKILVNAYIGGVVGLINLAGIASNYFNKDDSQKAMTANVSKLKKNQELNSAVSNAYKNIATFANLFSDNTEDSFDENGSLNRDDLLTTWAKLKPKLNQYVQTPFIEGSDNVIGSSLLSPARMVKYSVLVARLIMNKCGSSIVDSEKKGFFLTPKQLTNSFINIIQFIILLVILAIVILTTVFIVIDYCVCILEYLIVTGIAVIFVPCLLFDGTKSYASNLIRLFISYLFKIIVTISVLYYSYVMFLKVALRMLYEDDPNSWINLAWMLIMALLIKALQGTIPQIASAVTSGQPSLNLGNVMQAAQSSLRGMQTAGKVAGTATKVAAGAALGTLGFGLRQARNEAAINKASNVAGQKAMGNYLASKGKDFESLDVNEKKEALQIKSDAKSAYSDKIHSMQWQGKKQEILDFLTFGTKGTTGMDGVAHDVSYKAGKKDNEGRVTSQDKHNQRMMEDAEKFGNEFLPPPPKDQNGQNESNNLSANQVNDNESSR